jgi:hypothetical protein
VSEHLPDERIQDALDSRLTEAEIATLRDHAGSCETCGARWEALARLKSATARLPLPEPPAALAEAVQAGLDAEDVRSARPGLKTLSLAAGLVALAAAVGVTARFAMREQPGRRPSLPAQAAQDFRDLRSGSVALSLRTSSPAELEQHLARAALDFPTRVYDLSTMRQRLLGGSVGRLAGRPTALLAYLGEDGSLLVCRMLRGAPDELPEPDRQREHDGIVFRIYHVAELTLVFWAEGEVLCALVGDGPADGIVALALAKAMKAVA